MTETYFDVLIVGGGHGGAQTASVLRTEKYEGSIAILSDEPDLPYERPPLSKEYFSGEKDFDRIAFRSADKWAERNVSVLLGRRVTSVDPASHAVQLADGARIGYGKLVWAAGGAPRKLSCAGADLAGVFSVRTRADVDSMKARLDATTHVVVVGGGYIGLEAAAVLAKAGKTVTVLEAMDRVLARVAGEPLSRFIEAEHRAHGVDIRLGARLSHLVGADGQVSGVALEGGEVLPAEMVIVGIGITPTVGPLQDAGAACANGVSVNELCETSLPDVFAIGDCAEHANRFAEGDRIRLESVQNAHDQAALVARLICGKPKPYDAIPWFWSNQYDIKLQTVGLSRGHDATVLRGDPATRSFSVVYLRRGQVIAFDCVNAPRDYMGGKGVVLAGVSPDLQKLADPAVSLKDLIPATPPAG